MIPGMPTGDRPLSLVDDLQDTLSAGPSDGAPPRSATTVVVGQNVFAKAGFVLTRFPFGLFWFLAIVIGLSVGIGTSIIMIGVVILGGLFHLLRAGARFERGLIKLVGGPEIQDPYRRTPRGAGFGERWRNRLRDPASYRDALYLLMQFPLGLLTLVTTTVTLSVTLGALASPLFYNRMGSGRISFFGDSDESLFVVDRLWKALLLAAVGLILLPLLPLMTRAISALHFDLAALLLGPTRREEVTEALEQRDLGLAADMTERKRIERDRRSARGLHRCSREAHQQHLHQTRPSAVSRRSSPSPCSAAVPATLTSRLTDTELTAATSSPIGYS